MLLYPGLYAEYLYEREAMPEARDADGPEAPERPVSFFPLADALEAKLASGYVFPVPAERSPEQKAELSAVGQERAAQFAHATQGKGKPMTYGHGSRERYLKETKG